MNDMLVNYKDFSQKLRDIADEIDDDEFQNRPDVSDIRGRLLVQVDYLYCRSWEDDPEEDIEEN